MVIVKVNPEGKFKYTTDAEGEYHSFNDLPAIEYLGNQKIWMYHGLIHRDKLPAFIDGGKMEYYNKGELILSRENNSFLYKGYIKLVQKDFYDTKNETLKQYKLYAEDNKKAIEFKDNSIEILNIGPEYVMLNQATRGQKIFKDGSLDMYNQNGFKRCNTCNVNEVYYYFTDSNDKGYENFRYYCFCEGKGKIKELIKP